jgi:hypothetical protein
MKKRILSLIVALSMLISVFGVFSISATAASTPSDWAVTEVNAAIKEGLVTDKIIKDYQKAITREEFCELVVKLYQKLTNETVSAGYDPFTDTDNEEILKAYSLGIVKGVSDNEFAPNNNITRQEICVMLTRCIDIAIDGADITSFETNHFADGNNIADWAIDSVNYAFDNEIIKGVGDNKVDPLGNTTCEQSILLGYRIYKNQDTLVIFEDITEDDLNDLFSIKKKVNDSVKTYLKDFGAATASNGAVGLYHIDNLTPEAVELGGKLITDEAKVYVIDDAELERVKNNYPVIWKDKDATPKLCFMGCPHMSLQQLKDWTDKVEAGLKEAGNKKVVLPTVFTAAPKVLEEFEKTEYAARLKATGVITSYICPLMYMNNPLCKSMPVITSSNKLRTYTTARYYTDDEILVQITKGGK